VALTVIAALGMTAARADDDTTRRRPEDDAATAAKDPATTPISDEDAPAPVTADGSGALIEKQGPYGGTNLTQCSSGLPAPC
jgi:hypothetical protein